MSSWNPPTDEEIERLVAFASRPENRSYFFDRLENPTWVSALAKRGFFTDPPDPVPADQPGYVRFPPWPEGRYLARVASSVPNDVTAVLEEISTHENPTVTRHLLEAAGALPNEHVRRLGPRIVEWLNGPFLDHFADEAAALSVRLFEAGDTARGLAAVEELLQIQADPRASAKATGDSPVRLPLEPSGRVSDWDYERIIERVKDSVATHAGIAGLRVFCTLLDVALRHSAWDDDPGADQTSHAWRPAIEEHSQNTDRDVRSQLIAAVRDIATALAEGSGEGLQAVIDILEGRSLLHQRIALHVLATSSFRADLASERIADPQIRENPCLRHELATLLRRRFGDADNEVKRSFLSWIEAGPDLEMFRQAHQQQAGEFIGDEELQRYAQTWRRDWYSLIADHLQAADAERYQELVAAVGPPEHPDFLVWSEGGWAGPESPNSVEELLTWSPDQVVSHLRTWVPADTSVQLFGPSIEGLGDAFSQVVKRRAMEYALLPADNVADLDPTYVRSFFHGLENRLREDGDIYWEQPLAVATAALSHPFEPDMEAPDRDRDPDWRSCRRAVTSFLRTALTRDGGHIPFGFREKVWAIIEKLTHDENPSPKHEERYGGNNMDPLTLSLNTNRGTAMHAVVEYGLWCRRELESLGEDVTRGFELMPELKPILQRHLNPDVEPSLAVRAVYGRWLPWLLLLDETWTTNHLHEIFPDEPAHSELKDTAWATYLTACPPYDSAYRTLRHLYEEGVQRIPSGLKGATFARESADAKLGQHLVVFYWRSVADESLLDKFFEKASDELAGTVMEFVGRALRNAEDDVPPPVLERIRELWNRRLGIIAEDPAIHREEARAFGISFSSARLDDDWALPALETAVTLGGAPKISSLAVKRLAAMAPERPVECARVLALMLTNAENEWDFLVWRDEAKAIVQAARASGNQEASSHCATIVDFYVKRRQFEFRELAPTTRTE